MGCIDSKQSKEAETQELQHEGVENDDAEEHDAKIVNKSVQHISTPAAVPDQLTFVEPINKEELPVKRVKEFGESKIHDDQIEKLNESIKVDEVVEKGDVAFNEEKEEHRSEGEEMKSSDKVAVKEFSKYTGSQKYKISKRSSRNSIHETENENNRGRNDTINTQEPMKTTRIETLHDKVVGSVKVKETKEYESSEYEGNKTSRIVHTKILGDQSYQTVIILENDIQKDFQIKTDMKEDEDRNSQNKGEDLMSSSLIEMINEAVKNMPQRHNMEEITK